MSKRQNRRQFLEHTLIAGTCTGMLASHLYGQEAPETTANEDKRFQLGPDRQFDLQLRAALSMNPLLHLLDEQRDYQPYFFPMYKSRPPAAAHIRWDFGDCVGRYVDALKLARIMTGNTDELHIDDALGKYSEKLLTKDGLSSWPNGLTELTWTQRGALTGFTTQYAFSGQKRFATLAQNLIDGLAKLVFWKDGMAFFPRVGGGDMTYAPNSWKADSMSTEGAVAAMMGALIWPLTRFGKLAGYEPAIRLARGVAEYCLRGAKLFHPDGRFCDTESAHFHARTATALGLLKLGVVTGNKDYVGMAERVYNQAKQWGTAFGWFPEDLHPQLVQYGSETCCITDMIELAIGLGMWVNPKYYNDAERYGRNHLLEAQLLRVDWVDEYQKEQKPRNSSVNEASTVDRVMQRCLGGFAGWSGVSEWTTFRGDMMGCCMGAGTRGLYDLWHYAVDRTNDQVSVNLLFSKATKDVVVKSHLPFEGKVDIECRADLRLRVRLPDYITRDSLKVARNGSPVAVEVAEGWISLPTAKKNDVMQVRFDLPERTESTEVRGTTYQVKYRGDTVFDISPPGTCYPLYERQWVHTPPATFPAPLESRAKEIDSI